MAKPTPKQRPKRASSADGPRAVAIDALLERAYPDAECALDHQTPFQLLVATILSAQCTDARVNIVTRALFQRAPDAAAMAALGIDELEVLVHSTGFFRAKAKNIHATARLLVAKHAGEVPQDMDALLQLPGVARKTANVVLGTVWGISLGVVVDTHVQRLTGLLGLVQDDNPVRIEQVLMQLLPQKRWIGFSHRIILHGRAVCIANRPRCNECTLASLCPSASAVPARKP